MRTNAYIDGFKPVLRSTQGYGLQMSRSRMLIRLVLVHKHDIACIKYFTAKVKVSETDPDQRERQKRRRWR